MPTLADVLRQGGYIQDGQIVRQPSQTAQALNQFGRNVVSNAAQNLANQRADIDAALTMGPQGIQVGDKEAFARQLEMVPNMMGSIKGIAPNRVKQDLSSFAEDDILDYARAVNKSVGKSSAKDEAAAAVMSGVNNKFIVYDGKNIAGAASYNVDEPAKTVFIDHLGSLLKGTGRQMVEEIEKNVPRGYKIVLTSSDEAKGFWDKLGFKPTGQGSLLQKTPEKQLIPDVYQEAFELERRTGMRPNAGELDKIQKIRDMMERERLSRREILEKELSKAKK